MHTYVVFYCHSFLYVQSPPLGSIGQCIVKQFTISASGLFKILTPFFRPLFLQVGPLVKITKNKEVSFRCSGVKLRSGKWTIEFLHPNGATSLKEPVAWGLNQKCHWQIEIKCVPLTTC